MQIREVGAELFHADGRADRRDAANSRNFANMPENVVGILQTYDYD
jgi:hypothetical protein